MKTAVIYARYSSDNQTEQSIEGQLRVCQDYAERNNIVILKTYIDRAMTGTNDNRPDFQQMIKDSANKEFEYIIVYKLDRFSRNKYETAKNKKILKDNSVKLLSAMENIPDTPEGIILESLLEGMAEYYSAELAQKVKRGMKETRLKGNFTGGHIAYGYKVENHKVVIDEEKAKVVRFIYEQYAIGTYVKDIIDDLTSRRILNNGKPFAQNTIYNILKNEKYSGIYRFGDDVFDNTYPAIVSSDIYNRVRKRVDLNKYGRRSTQLVYLLRFKLKCGYCGMPMSAETGTAKDGSKRNYYKCLGRKRHNGCKKSSVRKDVFENFILDNILKVLSSQKHIASMVDALYNLQERQSNNNTVLNSLIEEKIQVESSLSNIMKAVEQGVINTTTNKRMKELESQLEDIDKQIILEKSKSAFKVSKQDIKEFYLQALSLEPKILIDYVIDEIRVYEDKLEIKFNSPIKRSPDDNQGFFLFTFNTKLLQYAQKSKSRCEDFKINFYV